ncbi:MAG: zinc ribbon domain-containing protein [Eubacteriales bacterium]|nr:zinc ribbon domain-containing protein [Eubacteriales bacterium]
MASYKQPCMHCGALIDTTVRFCPKCASRSPFGYVCPSCRTPIDAQNIACSGCGRLLKVECPHCKQPTFIGEDTCEHCHKSLLKQCKNKRCNEMQFFDLKTCTACGKKMK